MAGPASIATCIFIGLELFAEHGMIGFERQYASKVSSLHWIHVPGFEFGSRGPSLSARHPSKLELFVVAGPTNGM